MLENICAYMTNDYPGLGVYSSKHADLFFYNYNVI
jgi:hypothetical protein